MLLVGCSGKGSSTNAAVVNGENITMDQFNKYLMLKPQVQVIVVPAQLTSGAMGQLPQQPYTGQVVGSLGLQALNDLIQQTVLRQLAKDEGVYPTQEEITADLDERTKTNPTFLKDLTAAGFSLEMIKSDIALQLAQYKLTTKGINVSDDEVTTYIGEHPKEFVQPEAVDMLWMLVPEDKKKAADADLKSGNSFIMVAAKYSVAPNTRAAQYKFPVQYVPQLATYGQLMPAVKKANAQEQTDWIKFSDGWAKFYINKKTPEKALPIDDAMRKRVKKLMALQKGTMAKDVNVRVQDKLKAANIVITIDSLKEPWKRSMEQLQTVTGGSTTPSTAPGGTP